MPTPAPVVRLSPAATVVVFRLRDAAPPDAIEAAIGALVAAGALSPAEAAGAWYEPDADEHRFVDFFVGDDPWCLRVYPDGTTEALDLR